MSVPRVASAVHRSLCAGLITINNELIIMTMLMSPVPPYHNDDTLQKHFNEQDLESATFCSTLI